MLAWGFSTYKGAPHLENRGYISTGKFLTSYLSDRSQSTSNGKTGSSACGGILILWYLYDYCMIMYHNYVTMYVINVKAWSQKNWPLPPICCFHPCFTTFSVASGCCCREVWQRGRLCHQVSGSWKREVFPWKKCAAWGRRFWYLPV